MKNLKFTLPITVICEIIIGVVVWASKVSWDFDFWESWFALIMIILPIVFLVASIVCELTGFSFDETEAVEHGFIAMILIGIAIFVIIAIVSSFSSPLWKSSSYYNNAENMVTVVEAETSKDVFPELIKNGDTSKLPMYATEEALKFAKAELAKSTSLESQVKLCESDFMTQNLNGNLVYTNATQPRSVFKRHSDQQFYVIDRNTGETVSYDASNFDYMNGQYFGANVKRYLQNEFKGQNINDIILELDDECKPYYVATVLDKDFAFGYTTVEGIVVLDPVTGDYQFYEVGEEPAWVDRVYPEDVLISYIKSYGQYADGFWNSLFAQKGVIQPTGISLDTTYYEIVYVDGEAFLWTDMNSANFDGSSDSNGVILASLKTGKITYYKTSGVSERHAMEVAEGLVQEKGYSAGYPIPIRVDGIPSMFMIMRDDTENITGYSLVSYKDYTKSAYATNVTDLVTEYLSTVGQQNEGSNALSNAELKTIEGTIDMIASEVVDGRTMYYILVNGQIYSMTSKLDVDVVFAKIGDVICITYAPSEAEVIPVRDVEFK